MKEFIYEKDSDSIVTICMDMDGPVNTMNDEFSEALENSLQKLEAETDLRGVVFASAKKSFFAGGNLHDLLSFPLELCGPVFEGTERTKSRLRRLEKLPVPVVAAINGPALGGGFEVCLACNERVLLNEPSAVVGLPEVSLGLMPGGGGTVRMVQMFGLKKALPYLLEARRISPQQALEEGLVDELVDNREDLIAVAKRRIKAHTGPVYQAWDRPGYVVPGASISSDEMASFMFDKNLEIARRFRGLLPAQLHAMDVAYQAAMLNFDQAQTLETRRFVNLLVKPVAKNRINSGYFQSTEVSRLMSDIDPKYTQALSCIRVIGSDTCAVSIAIAAARAGIRVGFSIVPSSDNVNVDAGIGGEIEAELDGMIATGRLAQDKKAGILELIQPELQAAAIIFASAGSDVDITALSEALRSGLSANTENAALVLVNNQSSAAEREPFFEGFKNRIVTMELPDKLHDSAYVSLVKTVSTDSDAADIVRAFLGKVRRTAIVSTTKNSCPSALDSFAYRLKSAYIDEGLTLLAEGVDPVVIENIALSLGMIEGPLKALDGVGLDRARVSESNKYVIEELLDKCQRRGKSSGAGIYDYPESEAPRLWPDLQTKFVNSLMSLSHDDVRDRLLYRQVLTAMKCFDQGVIDSIAEANIGSLMLADAPVWTGGWLQMVNTTDGEHFQQRCHYLQAKYGDRFKAPRFVIHHGERSNVA